MKTSIGEFISRVRRQIKAVKQDAFLTDRFLYSITIKQGSWLMKREDSMNKLLSNDSIIQTLGFVELIEVDRTEAGCHGIRTNCRIQRTRYKLPEFIDGYYGPLIRAVTSLDASQDLSFTDPVTYMNMTKQTSFRFNKRKYCWFLNEYLYFPNLGWDAVRIEGISNDDLSDYNCEECKKCKRAQDRMFSIPSSLHAELESLVLQDLRGMLGVPSDNNPDKQNIAR